MTPKSDWISQKLLGRNPAMLQCRTPSMACLVEIGLGRHSGMDGWANPFGSLGP